MRVLSVSTDICAQHPLSLLTLIRIVAFVHLFRGHWVAFKGDWTDALKAMSDPWRPHVAFPGQALNKSRKWQDWEKDFLALYIPAPISPDTYEWLASKLQRSEKFESRSIKSIRYRAAKLRRVGTWTEGYTLADCYCSH